MRLLISIVIPVLIAASCGGGGSRCVEIVNDTVDVFQSLIDRVDELDLSDAAAAGDDFSFPGLADIERRADELQDEADTAGCDDDELKRLLSERIGRLEARTVFGQAVIEGIRQEGLFER